jgi:hypothetical protein
MYITTYLPDQSHPSPREMVEPVRRQSALKLTISTATKELTNMSFNRNGNFIFMKRLYRR